MKLEEKLVLHDRWRMLSAFREKEWFFSCLHDERAGLYLSWTVVRSFLAERFRLWLVDLRGGQQWSVEQPLFLDRAQAPGRLDLAWQRGERRLRYEGTDEGSLVRWQGAGVSLELSLERRWPAFTRRENPFQSHYGLLHWFGNEARGRITVEGRSFEIETRRCYTDHCWGRVPRRTGWHWLAVQDEQVALASLVNHGPYAQRYTQVLWEGRWHRLDPEVVFDYDPTALEQPWQVVSTDMELEMRPQKVHRSHVRIPPLLPFLIDLHHNEMFVEVSGRLRIDGSWQEVRLLTGVAEEHHGRW